MLSPDFGEGSIHDRIEGRGEEAVLITMIDDATSRVMARFYAAGTVESHMDLLGRWLRKYGRPLAVYTDRHSIFEPHEKGRPPADPGARTQFGRALGEVDVELIRTHSPQAEGRVGRSFGTAQDRWVKELRPAKVKAGAAANAIRDKLVPEHNERFARPAQEPADAHRRLGARHRLESILSVQRRRDGALAIRFGAHYLAYERIVPTQPDAARGNAPRKAAGQPPAATSGPKRPRADHPWRKRVVG